MFITQIRTTDNNGGIILKSKNIEDLSSIANKNFSDLQKENPDLFVFPHSLDVHSNGIQNEKIFSIHNNNLTTHNLMGFIGKGATQLTISSRFTQNDKNDYFLHYMLQKVSSSVNFLNFKHNSNDENIWDFLIYLFPNYLKRAFRQGVYKTYVKKNYNDPNIKGVFDAKRHLKKNTPFVGKIAYTTRENSADNSVNQLIRHTIEYIKSREIYAEIFNDTEVKKIVDEIILITHKTYDKKARKKIISDNLRSFSRVYFTEYIPLQKICLKILQNEKITFGGKGEAIYGLLFDGAWLWEEYLNTILKDDFSHSENKIGKNKHYLFENFQPIYPDFVSKFEPKVVIDAKYIPLDDQKIYSEKSEKMINIYYKTIAYMYRFNSNNGFLVFPYSEEKFFNDAYKIKETCGVLKKIGFPIPQGAKSFKEFVGKITQTEKELKQQIKIV